MEKRLRSGKACDRTSRLLCLLLDRWVTLVLLCFTKLIVAAVPGLSKSLARRPWAIAFSSRATKMYYCPARRATLNTGLLRVLKNSQFTCIKFKAIKSFKYVKWYKKSLNYNFKRSYSWGRKDKNRDTAGLNFKRQWCHWINMSAAHFKVKTQRRCLYVNVSLKGTVCSQKRVVGIFISSCL